MEGAFDIVSRGIGQADYTIMVERSTATLPTPSLRQEVMLFTLSEIYAVPPFPMAYQVFIPMPQEDGTWEWEASSITIHFLDFAMGLRNNCLCSIGLLHYNSMADLLAGIVGKWYPRVFDYGRVTLKYSKAVATQPGKIYAITFGFWSENITEEISMNGHGILTNPTLAWMLS